MVGPNIFIVMVDCLRADVCYGLQGNAVTPAINALAGRGAKSTRMISVTSATTPNIASVFTGLYPLRHGIKSLRGFKLASGVKTMAEVFKERGYHTYGLVSGPIRKEYSNLNRGFDIYDDHHDDGSLFTDWYSTLKDKINGFEGPWFAYLHLWELHLVRDVLKEHDRKEFGSTSYERSLSSIDSRLAELFGMLPDNTIVVLSGDHGENYKIPLLDQIRNKMSRLHGFGIKSSRRHPKYDHGYGIYDFLVHIPFIMAGPGIPSGAEVKCLSSQVDIMPTVLDMAGIDPQSLEVPVDGRSLKPAFFGASLEPRPVYMDATANIPSEKDWLKGVRTEEWKYIYAPMNPSIEPLLYDLVNDPDERTNLYRKRPDKAKELKDIILAHETETEKKGMTLKGEEMTADENAELEKILQSLGYVD